MKKSTIVFFVLFSLVCGLLCGWRWGFDNARKTAQLTKFPANHEYIIKYGSGDGIYYDSYYYE